MLGDLGREKPSERVFSRECLAHQLRTDIGYWLGAEQVDRPFREWVGLIIAAWKTGAVSRAVVRRRAADLLHYLERHGGIFTPRMQETLEELKAFIDSRRSESPAVGRLANLSAKCQRLIEKEVFRPSGNHDRFGGIGP